MGFVKKRRTCIPELLTPHMMMPRSKIQHKQLHDLTLWGSTSTHTNKTMRGLLSSLVSSDVAASSALAAAITVHTLEESFQVPSYQIALGLHQISTVSEVLLDSLPIFAVLPVAAFATKRFPWIRDTLTGVALFHPILDHVLLSLRWKHSRPGTFTALTLLSPLGILNLMDKNKISILGGGLGLVISHFLYLAAKWEMQDMSKRTSRKWCWQDIAILLWVSYLSKWWRDSAWWQASRHSRPVGKPCTN